MKHSKIVFLLLVFFALEVGLVIWGDRPVSDFMRSLENSNPAIIGFFRAITDFGKSKWYLWPAAAGVAAGGLLLRSPTLTPSLQTRLVGLWHKILFFFITIALSGLITDIIKPFIGRARPVERLREGFYGFHPLSFFQAPWNGMPSGHATTAVALAASLILLFPRFRACWVILGVVLVASRVVVNAHYLSDVLLGALVGLATTLFVDKMRDEKGMFPIINGIFPIDKAAPPR